LPLVGDDALLPRRVLIPDDLLGIDDDDVLLAVAVHIDEQHGVADAELGVDLLRAEGREGNVRLRLLAAGGEGEGGGGEGGGEQRRAGLQGRLLAVGMAGTVPAFLPPGAAPGKEIMLPGGPGGVALARWPCPDCPPGVYPNRRKDRARRRG